MKRSSQRIRHWAALAADRAGDPGADTAWWHGIARQLYAAAKAYDDGLVTQGDELVGQTLAQLVEGQPS